jgi:anti-sigma regulatory factor (Ser/Thr protein kinase)
MRSAATEADPSAWTPVQPARTPRGGAGQAAEPEDEPEPPSADRSGRAPACAAARPSAVPGQGGPAGPEEWSGAACWQFPPLPVHARMARRWLEAWIADRGPGGEAGYRAAVAFSELVSNAVLHGSGPVSVRVLVGPGRIVCEVCDAACDLPVVCEAGEEDEHHRGLSLVDALTTEWRVRPRPEGGKAVTFTVEA